MRDLRDTVIHLKYRQVEHEYRIYIRIYSKSPLHISIGRNPCYMVTMRRNIAKAGTEM